MLVADKSPVTITCLLASSSCPIRDKIGSLNWPMELWSDENVVVPLIVFISIPSPFSPLLSLTNLNLATPSDASFDLTVNMGSEDSIVAWDIPDNTPPEMLATPSLNAPVTVKLFIPVTSLDPSNTTALPAAPVPAVAPSITDNSPSVTVDSPIITFVASIVVDVNLFIPVTSFEASRTTALEAEAVPSVTPSNLLRSVVDEVKPVNLLISEAAAVIDDPAICKVVAFTSPLEP